MEQDQKFDYSLLAKPAMGTALAVASGLSFFFLAMILPLVGPSGSTAPHAEHNKTAFLSVLLLTFVLAAFSTYSKFERRKIDGSPRPLFSLGMCAVCVLTLLVLLVGGFAI